MSREFNYGPRDVEKFTQRWGWNFWCAWLHLLQCMAAIFFVSYNEVAQNFRTPLLTHFSKWKEDVGPISATQELGKVPFAYITLAVPFIAFAAHGVMLVWKNKYEDSITRFYNTWRWIEYSISSTLMFFLICLLFSIYDLSLLIALCALNMTTMFCGYFMEQLNCKEKVTQWGPFVLGSFTGLVQWSLLYSTLSTAESGMPAIIWALLFSYFILYLLFPLNMYVLYKEWTNASEGKRTERFFTSEVNYMVLSLVSKTLLLWLIMFGVNQPSPYTA